MVREEVYLRIGRTFISEKKKRRRMAHSSQYNRRCRMAMHGD